MLLLLKKLILSITNWTNLSIERTFLFSENKAFSKKFYETQDVKVIFPRNTGCFFRETQDIIELLYRDKYYNKDRIRFFLVFERNKIVSKKKKLFQLHKQLVQ